MPSHVYILSNGMQFVCKITWQTGITHIQRSYCTGSLYYLCTAVSMPPCTHSGSLVSHSFLVFLVVSGPHLYEVVGVHA